MSLTVTPVSRSLDKKLLVLGFEIPDLLAIFLFLAVLNFVFGGHGGFTTIVIVWGPPAALGAALYFGKKDRPENYLIHELRYQISPGVYHAFLEPSRFEPVPTLREEKSE